MPKIIALPTETVHALQSGALDAYGLSPERTTSDGGSNPCRHCLKHIPVGRDMLILAHRPFPAAQPYAETGPIFLCAEPCERYEDGDLPEVLGSSPDYLIKGYNRQDRIIYGTGTVVEAASLIDKAADIFRNPDVAYIHIRSSRNNCYQARLDRD